MITNLQKLQKLEIKYKSKAKLEKESKTLMQKLDINITENRPNMAEYGQVYTRKSQYAQHSPV